MGAPNGKHIAGFSIPKVSVKTSDEAVYGHDLTLGGGGSRLRGIMGVIHLQSEVAKI